MNNIIGPVRRASIYAALSYVGLVVINNISPELPSIWVAYLPMFVAVYILTRWIDKRLTN